MRLSVFLTFSLLSCYIAGAKAGFKWGPDTGKPKQYFNFPPDCTLGHCEYLAKWVYDNKTDSVMFTISAIVERGYWAGIGFSNKEYDPRTDLVTGYMKKDRYHFLLDDRHTKYTEPNNTVVDKQQDAVLISHSYQNGKLEYKFKRKRFTGDVFDKSLRTCVYFKFVWGGTFSPEKYPAHGEKVFFSKNQVCVGHILPADPCRKTYCKENSHCVHNGHRSKCICNSGYSMMNGYCKKSVRTTAVPKPYKADPCLKLYCKQHERCVVSDGKAKCECKDGHDCKDRAPGLYRED